jgi:hypothetical protein
MKSTARAQGNEKRPTDSRVAAWMVTPTEVATDAPT